MANQPVNMKSIQGGYPFLTNLAASVSKNLLFAEAYGPDGSSLRSERLSAVNSSACSACFYVAYRDWTDAVINPIFRKSIVGGYYAPSNKRVQPLIDYYNPQLAATSIVDAKYVAVDPNSVQPSQVPLIHQLVMLTISFESLPYFTNASPGYDGNGNQYNRNWISRQTQAVSQHLTTPIGQYQFAEGPFMGKLAGTGFFQNGQLVYVVYTFYQVPSNWLFQPGTDIPVYAQYVGMVNKSTMFGYPEETLLLDSGEDEIFGDFGSDNNNQGTNIHTVKLTFIYNSFGWNTSPAANGNFYKIQFSQGTNPPPFESTDFVQKIWQVINPL